MSRLSRVERVQFGLMNDPAVSQGADMTVATRFHAYLAALAADEDGLPQDWLEQDATGSYYDAIAEIGKRVRAGAPVALCLLRCRAAGSP
jgi:hypothetical protein